MDKVEITASFTYKINLGNYESADIFLAQKKQCDIGKEKETYDSLFAFCWKNVMAKAVKFRTQIKDPITLAEQSILSNPRPTVEQWELMSPEEKWLRLELNRGVKRINYKTKKNGERNFN